MIIFKKILAVMASALMLTPSFSLLGNISYTSQLKKSDSKIIFETAVETTMAQEPLAQIIDETETEIAIPETTIEEYYISEEPIYTESIYYEETEITYEEPIETEPVSDYIYEASGRFSGIYLSEYEMRLMAAIVNHEANNQAFDGQQAVAEVVLNRVINGRFPNNVTDVLNAPGQFVSTYILQSWPVNDTNYAAVEAALYGPNILPADVVYFATSPLNGRAWGWIGAHCFCYI